MSHSRVSGRKLKHLGPELPGVNARGGNCRQIWRSDETLTRLQTVLTVNGKYGQCIFCDNVGESTDEVARQGREDTSVWAGLITEHVGRRTACFEWQVCWDQARRRTSCPTLQMLTSQEGENGDAGQMLTAQVCLLNCNGTWKFNFFLSFGS